MPHACNVDSFLGDVYHPSLAVAFVSVLYAHELHYIEEYDSRICLLARRACEYLHMHRNFKAMRARAREKLTLRSQPQLNLVVSAETCDL